MGERCATTTDVTPNAHGEPAHLISSDKFLMARSRCVSSNPSRSRSYRTPPYFQDITLTDVRLATPRQGSAPPTASPGQPFTLLRIAVIELEAELFIEVTSRLVFPWARPDNNSTERTVASLPYPFHNLVHEIGSNLSALRDPEDQETPRLSMDSEATAETEAPSP